jgi:metal-responsive CopG/Arc/MetJ family transcriptional regulator
MRISFMLDGKLLQDFDRYVSEREANKSKVIRNALETYLATKGTKLGGPI